MLRNMYAMEYIKGQCVFPQKKMLYLWQQWTLEASKHKHMVKLESELSPDNRFRDKPSLTWRAY